MPDPTYKTFLSPGSCQLEVTDLVATANDDKGVDLYGVAWEIEQVLIAGEGFAASPTDVWVNERGILNIGQSLFDKINRTAEDNDNVPGQCTVVVKATSLVDSSKVARLKVLVGYPGEGGGGGGGGAQTTDVYLWNMTGEVVPSKVEYVSGYSGGSPTYTQLEIEGVTNEFNESTVYGIKVKDCPAGGQLNYTLPSGYAFDDNGGYPGIGYSAVLFPAMFGTSSCAMIPIDGMYQVSPFVVITTS